MKRKQGLICSVGTFFYNHTYISRALVILIAVVYPYLCNLGGYPNIDEGVFGYSSQVYHYNITHGQSLAPLQGLSLWSLLLAWIPELGPIPLLWFRMADMVAAMLAGWLLCSIMQRKCGAFSNIIGLVFLLCMTSYLFIESGFKNSFFPAWACFLGSVLVIINKGKKAGAIQWLCAGALVALGIMLRETLFPFALLGLFTAYKKGGIKNALFYCLGGIICIIGILLCLEALAPGSIINIIKGYLDRRDIYATQNVRLWNHFLNYGKGFLIISMPALALTAILALSASLFYFWSKKFAEDSGKMSKPCAAGDEAISPWPIYFWLFVCLIPLYETGVKICFYYHFAQSLPGLACLGAICAGIIICDKRRREIALTHKYISICLLLAIVCCIFGSLQKLPNVSSLKNTINVFKRLEEKKWPDEMSASSIILQAVDKIQRQLPMGGTVSSSGALHLIFPASGLLPPLAGEHDPDDNYMLGDLSRFYLNTGKDSDRARKALLVNPPDIVVIAKPHGSHEPSFPDTLASILIDSGLYEKFSEINPIAPEKFGFKHYDWLALDLYRRKTLETPRLDSR